MYHDGTSLEQFKEIIKDPNIQLRIISAFKDIPALGIAVDFKESVQEYGIFLNGYIPNGIRDRYAKRVAKRLGINWEKLKEAEIAAEKELRDEWLEARALPPIKVNSGWYIEVEEEK